MLRWLSERIGLFGASRDGGARVDTKATTRPRFSRQLRVALRQLVRDAEPAWGGADAVTMAMFEGNPPDMFDGAATMLRRVGIEIDSSGMDDVDDVIERSDDVLLGHFVWACAAHLRELEQSRFYATIAMDSARFTSAVNRLCEAQSCGFALSLDGGWKPTVESDAAALYRALIGSADDAADFRQGDVQLEMVVSSVQEMLSRQGAVLVDYGVGLGRLLHALRTADRFKHAEYVGVDEPIDASAKRAGSPFSGTVRFVTRTDYLVSPVRADVAILLNTLHHIPFADLGRQFGALLRSIEPEGVLVVHEMGKHGAPEAYNVPWRYEHIATLLDVDEVDFNGRTTTSRSGVPLTHALVKLKGRRPDPDAIQGNAGKVWDRMKQDTLAEIRSLYASGTKTADAHLALQRAVIVNANLDLNRP